MSSMNLHHHRHAAESSIRHAQDVEEVFNFFRQEACLSSRELRSSSTRVAGFRPWQTVWCGHLLKVDLDRAAVGDGGQQRS